MSFIWGKSKESSKSKSKVSLPNGSNPQILKRENSQTNGDATKKKLGPSTLDEFPRILERRFGESLGFRNRILSDLSMSERPGLGLPDMIHMTLHDTYHDEEIGEYFYITGIDVSSVSMPIAFLKMLKLNQLHSPGDNIATYCCNNIFSKIDIRIRYETDGSVQVRAYDCLEQKILDTIDENIWEETFICCCMRSLITNKDPERKLPGLVEYPLAINNASLSGAKRVVRQFCKFLPRCLESGWDTTQHMLPTIFQNYLMRSLLTFLSVSPNLVDYALIILKELYQSDKENDLFYKIALIAILEQYDERDNELIKALHETLQPLMGVLQTMEQDDPRTPQILNCVSGLLNIQAKFLIKRGDYGLALSVSKASTELALDSPASWYYLAKCYIHTNEYNKALLAINSMPNLPTVDQDKKMISTRPTLYNYYTRPLGSKIRNDVDIDSNEFNNLVSTMKNWKDDEVRDIIFGRIAMPNKSTDGYIDFIWDKSCAEIGPIYGPQACNLINFVSPQEVQSIGDLDLLAKNTVAKQYGWFQRKAVQLLMELISRIGWNGLLKLRGEVFVMESEFMEHGGSPNLSNKDIPKEVREKRITERWLDQLFLDIYDDLKLSRGLLENNEAKYSGLEWELLGLTMLRAWQWDDAIACLRTSMITRFDYISCKTLLDLFMDYNPDGGEIIDLEFVLELVVQKISYEKRFYDSFQILNLQVLFKLCAVLAVDGVKSRIAALSYTDRSFLTVTDRMLGWVDIMTKE
ncbi:hypothetical protein C6P45_005114 [Maudiozyma exigua]|uniref:Uncharacterized protein n=1 Tax=Maudiozyma exigua TaxID=34358 RepID=A0A9P7B9W2_MAUEX|nr:hypothetical protein C6P45_005114 [Kazachstania exigua]